MSFDYADESDRGPLSDPAARADRGRAQGGRRPPRDRGGPLALQALRAVRRASARRRRALARRLGGDLEPALEPAAPARLDLGGRRRAADPARASRATTRCGAAASTTRCASRRRARGGRSSIRRATSRPSSTDPDLPAMGQRLRLKRGYDISRFPRQSRIVLRALKRYGMILADNGSSWYVSGAPDQRLEQRRPALAPRGARAARSRSWTPPVCRGPRLGSLHAAGSRRLLGLAVRQLARPALSGWPGQGPLARALLAGLRHRRGQLDLLPAGLARSGGPLGRADAARLRVRRQGEPLPDPHQAPAEPRARGSGATTSGIDPLVESGKLGPVVWQFPANFKRDDDRLGGALPLLPPGRHCFEFRHESWFTEPVYRLLRAHDAALVIADHPRWPFQARELTTDWTLVRLHHGHRGRRGNYSQTELDEWARRIARVAPPGRGLRLLQQRLGGLRRGQRARRSSGGCSRLQTRQRPAQ